MRYVVILNTKPKQRGEEMTEEFGMRKAFFQLLPPGIKKNFYGKHCLWLDQLQMKAQQNRNYFD